MYLILSQRRDFESSYSDKLFMLYHYPKRYRNQIQSGKTFVYYQGNRYDKNQRYYYGTGKIGKIFTTDDNNYYAELVECKRFNKTVPIYMDNGYIEQLDYQSIRKSPTPPWQSSIRPLSKEAYDYIITKAQGLVKINSHEIQVDLEVELKSLIKSYYREGNKHALKGIVSVATKLAGCLDIVLYDDKGIT